MRFHHAWSVKWDGDPDKLSGLLMAAEQSTRLSAWQDGLLHLLLSFALPIPLILDLIKMRRNDGEIRRQAGRMLLCRLAFMGIAIALVFLLAPGLLVEPITMLALLGTTSFLGGRAGAKWSIRKTAWLLFCTVPLVAFIGDMINIRKTARIPVARGLIMLGTVAAYALMSWWLSSTATLPTILIGIALASVASFLGGLFGVQLTPHLQDFSAIAQPPQQRQRWQEKLPSIWALALGTIVFGFMATLGYEIYSFGTNKPFSFIFSAMTLTPTPANALLLFFAVFALALTIHLTQSIYKFRQKELRQQPQRNLSYGHLFQATFARALSGLAAIDDVNQPISHPPRANTILKYAAALVGFIVPLSLIRNLEKLENGNEEETKHAKTTVILQALTFTSTLLAYMIVILTHTLHNQLNLPFTLLVGAALTNAATIGVGIFTDILQNRTPPTDTWKYVILGFTGIAAVFLLLWSVFTTAFDSSLAFGLFEYFNTPAAAIGISLACLTIAFALPQHLLSQPRAQSLSGNWLQRIFAGTFDKDEEPTPPARPAPQPAAAEIKDHGPPWQRVNISQMLRKKHLPADIFDSKPKHQAITLESSIEEHAAWAFNNIYHVPYPNARPIPDAEAFNIARYVHGIQHVSRVALYVQVFANLYCKHGDPEAMRLSEGDVKLLQIAALFHDSAREGEETDQWDHESAMLLYFYLRRVLNVEHTKAKLIAEATANKDAKGLGDHFEITEDETGAVTYHVKKLPLNAPKNIYQKIIHDADCLDIMRARPGYDAQHLDFYQGVAQEAKDDLPMDEVAHLITEARSLVEIQGDSYRRKKPAVKTQYENAQAYSQVRNSVDPNKHKIISALGMRSLSGQALRGTALVDLAPYRREADLTEDNMRHALREGKLFARGIPAPSAISQKHADETLAQLEVRKVMRAKGIPTRTQKPNNKEKTGNPGRSVSMLGYGSGVFSDAGFLIVEPLHSAIHQISATDTNTGRGKNKKGHSSVPRDENGNPQESCIRNALSDLHTKLKLGGETAHHDGRGEKKHDSTHVEIIYDVTQYNAIYYSQDPNLYNVDAFSSPEATHPYSPLLQAIYLQKQYAKQHAETDGEYTKYTAAFFNHGQRKFTERFGKNGTLPIFEYSGIHNTIRAVSADELTDDAIAHMWTEMCTAYMRKELENTYGHDIYRMPIDDIKMYSMYKKKENLYARYNGPADANYHKTLREKVKTAIEQSQAALCAEHTARLEQEISESKSDDVLSDALFFNLLRHPSPTSIPNAQQKIAEAIDQALKAPQQLFLQKKITKFFVYPGQEASNILYSLPTDFEELATKTQGHNRIFFETPAMRIYALSKRFGLAQHIQKIQAQATAFAEQSLQEILTALKQNTFIQPYEYFSASMLHLTKFIHAFDIESDQIRERIDEILLQVVTQSTQLFVTGEMNIKTYAHSLTELHNARLLTPAHIAFIKKTDESYTEFNTMEAYLQLAKLLDEDPKKELISWLTRTETMFGQDDDKGAVDAEAVSFIKAVGDCVPLNDNNLDVFQALITKIKPFRSTLMFRPQDISSWFDLMVDFQKLMPNGTFSQAQLGIVHKRWLSVCQEYICPFLQGRLQINDRPNRANFNFNDHFAQLVNNLSKFSRSSLGLPMEPLAQAFNAKLVELVQDRPDLVKKLDHKTISLIRQLDNELPWKEERQSLMMGFNTSTNHAPANTPAHYI